MTNFQRVGADSNEQVGAEFERQAQLALRNRGLLLERNYGLLVGIADTKKSHSFDLGSGVAKVIVECKSHKWTSGGNVPSAKMTVWNEAMYYFSVAPKDYRKILFVLKDYSTTRHVTLAEYYVRNYEHLIPDEVEVWEYDEVTRGVLAVRKSRANREASNTSTI